MAIKLMNRKSIEPLSNSRTARSEALDGDIDARDHIRLLWRHRWFIFVITLAFGIAATAAAFLVPNSYEASVLVQPVTSSSSTSGLSALMGSSVSGLATLAGLSVESNSKKAKEVAILQSRALTEEFIKENDLLPVLFSKDWDLKRNAWKVGSASDVPTLWKANRLFEKKIRRVSVNPTSGLVTLTITWRNPKVASEWANGLIKLANKDLRDQALRETKRDVAYLDAQAAKTSVVEMKETIYSLMRSVLSREMIARGTREYAFKVLDPAVPPQIPSSPKKMLWILAGIFGGLIVSTFVVFVRASWADIE